MGSTRRFIIGLLAVVSVASLVWLHRSSPAKTSTAPAPETPRHEARSAEVAGNAKTTRTRSSRARPVLSSRTATPRGAPLDEVTKRRLLFDPLHHVRKGKHRRAMETSMQLVQEHPNRYDVFEVLIRSACRLGEARIAAEYARRFPLDNPYVSPAKQRAVASNTVTYCRDLHHIDIVIPGIEPSPRR